MIKLIANDIDAVSASNQIQSIVLKSLLYSFGICRSHNSIILGMQHWNFDFTWPLFSYSFVFVVFEFWNSQPKAKAKASIDIYIWNRSHLYHMLNRNRIKTKFPFACKSTIQLTVSGFFLYLFTGRFVFCFVPFIIYAYCSLTAQVQNKLIHFFSLLVFCLFFYALFHCMVADGLVIAVYCRVCCFFFFHECIIWKESSVHLWIFRFVCIRVYVLL